MIRQANELDPQVCPPLLTQKQVARRLKLDWRRVQRIEAAAKLRLLQRLALWHPEVFSELGGTATHRRFLCGIDVRLGNSLHLWQKWCDLILTDWGTHEGQTLDDVLDDNHAGR